MRSLEAFVFDRNSLGFLISVMVWKWGTWKGCHTPQKMLPIYKNNYLYASQALQNTLLNQIGMTGKREHSEKGYGRPWAVKRKQEKERQDQEKARNRDCCSRRKFGSSWEGGWFSDHWLAEGQHYFKTKFTLIWTSVCWRWRRHYRMPASHRSAKSLQYMFNSSPGRPGTHRVIWVIPRGWEKPYFPHMIVLLWNVLVFFPEWV